MRARREPKNKAKQVKKVPKKPQQVFFHVFAQATHVVAAPHGFACVGTPTTSLYIPSSIEIRSGVTEPRQNLPFTLLWLLAFTTAYKLQLYYRTSRDWCSGDARIFFNQGSFRALDQNL